MWDREKDNLVICLAISLALHLLAFVFVVVLGGSQFLADLFRIKPPPEEEEAPRLVLLQTKPPPPQHFVETDASQESKQKPKQAPFYSERNTLAQDQSSRVDQNRPEIKGRDKLSPATEDVVLSRSAPPSPPSSAKPPSPADPPQKNKSESKPTEKAQPNPAQDDLAKKQYALLKPHSVEATPAQPDDVPVEAQQAQPPEVPTPEQARAPPSASARPPVRSIPTQASSLTGGISRKGVISFDTQESPAGYYDKILMQAISQRWYLLVGDRYRNQGGTVRVQFELSSAGEISNVTILDSGSVGPVLASFCKRAVAESGPFGPFPGGMRTLVGDSRQMTIFFQYSF